MPYNVLNLATGELARDGDSIAVFESPGYAVRYAEELTRLTSQKHQLRVVVSDDWKARELNRFISGEYLPVAWQYAGFWSDRSDELKAHFCHRSKDKPAFIAFTESPEKGARDIQTRLRPGVYLKRYFGDVLSDAEITQYARLHAMLSGETEYEIKFARTADEIEQVYITGPASCMSESARQYSGIHPVRVYGDSDLQLAYIKAESSYHEEPIMARALVWPEKQVYGRVYPTPERYYDSAREEARAAQAALVRGLESLGFTRGEFEGATIRKIESRDGGHVMPYLDGVQSVSDCGDVFKITSRGEYSATNTNGLLEDGATCESCDGGFNPDDGQTVRTARYGEQTWCPSCVDNSAFYCHGNEELYADYIDHVEVDGEIYSLYYARENFYYCQNTCEWNADGTTSVYVRPGYQEEWSADALEEAFYCDGSAEWYACEGFDSVVVGDETYEKSHAFLNGLLSKQSEETESESA
jgi:hypothetical protein